MHILSGKSKSIDISTSREGGERDVCSFLISSFFYLRISKFRVYLCKKF